MTRAGSRLHDLSHLRPSYTFRVKAGSMVALPQRTGMSPLSAYDVYVLLRTYLPKLPLFFVNLRGEGVSAHAAVALRVINLGSPDRNVT